ncbi:MAG: hypothetical protein ACRDBL_04590 [Rhabdaerophilum sp.]
MPFETIENLKALSAQISVFPDGVRVQARTAGRTRRGGGQTRFIKVTVGAQLARKLVWRDEVVRIDLAFGSGRDAGKIRASVNLSAGQFVARRDRQGRYVFTINAATADGLFALTFPDFYIPALDPVSAIGTPPALIFAASEAMLAAD